MAAPVPRWPLRVMPAPLRAWRGGRFAVGGGGRPHPLIQPFLFVTPPLLVVPHLATELDTDVFVATTVPGDISFGIDAGSNELDVVFADSLNDIAWGELGLAGGEATAPSVPAGFDGNYSYVAAITDPTNDLQIGASNNAVPKVVTYARLSAAGAVEQAPVARFSNGADDDEMGDVDVKPTTLFWAFRRASTKIMFATTDLSGTVVVAPVQVVDDPPSATRPVLTIDSKWRVHVFWKTADGIRHAALDRNGATVITPTTISASQYTPIGAVVDTEDRVYVFATQFLNENLMTHYAILSTDGATLRGLTLLTSRNSPSFDSAAVRLDARSNRIFHLVAYDSDDNGSVNRARLIGYMPRAS